MTERILITGAGGRIGTLLRPRMARPGRVLRLHDLVPLTPGEDEEAVTGDVTDPAAMAEAADGADAVVHLAGRSSEGVWDDVLHTNVHGGYVVLEAARRAGARRVVLASSNHAVGFHPRSGGAAPDHLFPRPDTFYGVSKAALESLGSLYADRYGMDVVCLRIGYCGPRPLGRHGLGTWLSPGDCARLVEACLSAPEPGFRVVWGVSDNTRRWWSLEAARSLGYEPEDDAEVFAADWEGEAPAEDLDPERPTVGGLFCDPELDVDRLERRAED
ncbi:NAD-dependent epimerase/dehydratase family protein [Actinorugispora endophytica]|uniref:NAD-dependent epimerase/dehydratase family protein n=1 Tax=Actinorugispora endophytica TaxID=1605990 RepID=A0A4R6UMZ6_9ACTN|nr:NAD(P)-dependent oxidoreductase [Actinorugispora endophytica]TDQ48490.1 NAD-dependent epimerase/dehydratase family protein [Actinorugispora endophytica]